MALGTQYAFTCYSSDITDVGKKEEVVKAWDAGKVVVPSDGAPGQSGKLSSAASNHKEWLRMATETYEVEYEEVSLSSHFAAIWNVLYSQDLHPRACGSLQQYRATWHEQSTETQPGR